MRTAHINRSESPRDAAARWVLVVGTGMLMSLGAAGCARQTSITGPSGEPTEVRVVKPADFIAASPTDVSDPESTATTIDATTESSSSLFPSSSDGSMNSDQTGGNDFIRVPGESVTVSGLVGQVNGRPIYVDDVFKPIADELRIQARELPRREFQAVCYERILTQLRTIVINELMLAEAEANLDDEGRQGLLVFLRQAEAGIQREAGGSKRSAERRLERERGITMEEHMKQFRRGLLVQEQWRREIASRIVVTWRDIERYYENNLDEFTTTPSMQIRLLMVNDVDSPKVEQVRAALAAGEPFADVVSEYADTLQRSGGLIETPLNANREETDFSAMPLHFRAASTLDVGEYAGPIETESGVIWVYLEGETRAATVSLFDAQRQIEETLRTQMMREEEVKYFERLMKRGNFDQEDFILMGQSLLEVALDRWLPAE